MKKKLSLAIGAALLSAAALPALAQQSSAPDGMTTQGPTVWVNTNVVRGTVTQIDPGQRMLGARTDDGRTMTLAVGPDVNNFDTLKQGDRIMLRYTEAEAIALAKPTDPGQQTGEIRSRVESFATAQAPQGAARPVLGATKRTTVVANVLDIDRQQGVLTLRGTGSEPVDVRVDPKVLEQIGKDDQVVISYIEATAVAIQPERGGMSNSAASGRSGGSRDAGR